MQMFNPNSDTGFAQVSIVDLEEIQKEMDRHLGRPEGTSRKLKTFVQDRAGYDRRYAIDATKIQKELGWEAGAAFTEGLQRTVARYAS